MRNLLQSTYVDNIVTGAKDEVDAYKMYTESNEILKSEGYNLQVCNQLKLTAG